MVLAVLMGLPIDEAGASAYTVKDTHMLPRDMTSAVHASHPDTPDQSNHSYVFGGRVALEDGTLAATDDILLHRTEITDDPYTDLGHHHPDPSVGPGLNVEVIASLPTPRFGTSAIFIADPMGPSPSLPCNDGCAYIIGGMDDQGNAYPEVVQFDPATLETRTFPCAALGGREVGTSTAHLRDTPAPELMYIIGGEDTIGTLPTTSRDILAFDFGLMDCHPRTAFQTRDLPVGAWSERSFTSSVWTPGDVPRSTHCSTPDDECPLIIGGKAAPPGGGGALAPTDEIWTLKPDPNGSTDIFVELVGHIPTGPLPGLWGTSAVYQPWHSPSHPNCSNADVGCVFVFGGTDGNQYSDRIVKIDWAMGGAGFVAERLEPGIINVPMTNAQIHASEGLGYTSAIFNGDYGYVYGGSVNPIHPLVGQAPVGSVIRFNPFLPDEPYDMVAISEPAGKDIYVYWEAPAFVPPLSHGGAGSSAIHTYHVLQTEVMLDPPTGQQRVRLPAEHTVDQTASQYGIQKPSLDGPVTHHESRTTACSAPPLNPVTNSALRPCGMKISGPKAGLWEIRVRAENDQGKGLWSDPPALAANMVQWEDPGNGDCKLHLWITTVDAVPCDAGLIVHGDGTCTVMIGSTPHGPVACDPSAFDQDSDDVPDDAEPFICMVENQATTLDGHCTPNGGNDYHPPLP